jgi:hypothetical protein
MKNLLLLLMIAFSFVIAKAQSSDATPYLIKTLSDASIKNVEAKTSGGSISVAGGNEKDARIEVYISSNKHGLSKDEIEKILNEDYEFSVTATGNKLTAIAKHKSGIQWNNKRSLSIAFRIFVPENVSTDLSTSGGSISINNVSGTEDFATSGGSLEVKKLSGKINGRTSGGSINVSDSKDDIDLSTSGGSIDASNCIGKIKLNTSGGSVSLTDLKGDIKASTSGGSVTGKNITGDLSAHTSGGNVHLHDLACSLDASTSGGNINAEIVEAGKFIKLNNSGGNIDLQIPKDKGYDLDLRADKINTAALNNFSGSTKDKHWEGKLNGGGIPVNVDAGGGKINLSFK